MLFTNLNSSLERNSNNLYPLFYFFIYYIALLARLAGTTALVGTTALGATIQTPAESIEAC